jgi:hypothetical protein
MLFIPHSAFRIARAPIVALTSGGKMLFIPHSAFRIPHSVSFPHHVILNQLDYQVGFG